MQAMTVDPITLSVLQNGLMQVCNEMDLAFVRSAFSPVIAEALDRSDGIYHRDTGELIAQGELGLPVFVGTMQFTVQAVIERVNRLKIPLAPGEVAVTSARWIERRCSSQGERGDAQAGTYPAISGASTLWTKTRVAQ